MHDLVAGLRLPVLGAPMYIVSNPALVAAQCQAGIVGSFPAMNARGPDALDEWLDRIADENAAQAGTHPGHPTGPVGVNLIVHRTNERLDADLATVVRRRVRLVITSLGVQPEVNHAVHEAGGLVLHDVTNQRHAHRAIEAGADGLILVAAGAGGHAGVQSPFALLAETRQWFDGPIVLAGAIASGRAILAARILGADMVSIGSPFIATDEANAADGYKRMVVESSAADIVYSDLFTGVHGNYLTGSIRGAGYDPDNLPRPSGEGLKVSGAATAWRDIWGCGQGIGAISAIGPAGTLVDRLLREYRAAAAEARGFADA
ncbi:NAD(P)H-dependent flavin oxidoreductase [Lichenicoccus roseus]|uniref:Nitronate monooxygenase n=1 Tax=Lichenicoccus roseus TaxID=2683649 RepID=A0A5R9J2B1_9PROT|nr:nitronate monooxygenase family protein [Lichenicoccus roseus]TLU71770.1 nitronate monooxygenase [Lichenicoccus roseus]